MNEVLGSTRVYALLGWPVAHSLSPPMHNAAFGRRGMDAVYVALPVPPRRLPVAVEGLRALGVAGANVTVPHKEAVLDLLDGVDREAREIGAANVIVRRDGKLLGYNTDGRGFIEFLRRDGGLRPRGQRVVVLGAGGAASAVVHGLGAWGARSVLIANRTEPRARRLAARYRPLFPSTAFEALGLDPADLGEAFARATLVVNATPIGLEGWKGTAPSLPLRALPAGAVVADLVYVPRRTALLRKARRRGLKTLSGLGMLLYQGALAFHLWTGRRPPLPTMRQALMRALETRP